MTKVETYLLSKRLGHAGLPPPPLNPFFYYNVWLAFSGKTVTFYTKQGLSFSMDIER